MKRFIFLLFLIGLLSILEIKAFQWIPKQKGEELLFFPSGKFINAISSGFDNIFADFIWIEAGVYYGGHRMTDKRYPYLYRILDVLTDLDYRLIPGYTLGAILLTDDVKSIDLAMELLDKGMFRNPQRWEIPFVKGFIYYLYSKDYAKASKWFLISSRKKDAPDMVIKFATWTMSSQKGVKITLDLWLHLYRVSKNPLMREKAILGLKKTLWIQILRFNKAEGYFPESLINLKQEGYIPYIPELNTGKFVLREKNIIVE